MMQLFPCPFCGLRSEIEFHFEGEYGNSRPEGPTVDDQTWSSYLHLRNNPKGASAEIWMHLTCGEVFRLDRNTVDHRVSGSAMLFEELQP
jgi:sarcosine oxidase, subunit delta